MTLNRAVILLAVLAGCGSSMKPVDAGLELDAGLEADGGTALDAGTPATANPDRGIASTALSVRSSAGRATIVLEPGDAGATLEIGDLRILEVKQAGLAIEWVDRGALLDLGVGASSEPVSIDVAWEFSEHTGFDGFTTTDAGSFTFTWPYFCGNLFPCHSRPDDGMAFSVQVEQPSGGLRVVAPTGTISEAPSYQLAWAIGDYQDLELGTTSGGTRLTVSYLPGELANAQAGSAHLVAAFSWLESTLGKYPFGPHAGAVSVKWGPGAYGGMEHHPLWHISSGSLFEEKTNVHEAAHGWFGDGVRIACWEDFVLSEGTATYLSGRALDVVAPTVGEATWRRYATSLANLNPAKPAWPEGCQRIDIIKDGLFSQAPYMRGAFFLRAVAGKVGAAQLDQALSAFFRTYVGTAARMDDLLGTIKAETGFDPTQCAQAWLRSPTIPAIGPCP